MRRVSCNGTVEKRGTDLRSGPNQQAAEAKVLVAEVNLAVLGEHSPKMTKEDSPQLLRFWQSKMLPEALIVQDGIFIIDNLPKIVVCRQALVGVVLLSAGPHPRHLLIVAHGFASQNGSHMS